MERAFTQRLRNFLNNPSEQTWIGLNIDDYVLDDQDFDQELRSALHDYTDVESLRRGYNLARSRLDAVEDSRSEEYRRMDMLLDIIQERVDELEPRVVPNPSDSSEPLLSGLSHDRTIRQCDCSQILLTVLMATVFIVGLYITMPGYFPRLQ